MWYATHYPDGVYSHFSFPASRAAMRALLMQEVSRYAYWGTRMPCLEGLLLMVINNDPVPKTVDVLLIAFSLASHATHNPMHQEPFFVFPGTCCCNDAVSYIHLNHSCLCLSTYHTAGSLDFTPGTNNSIQAKRTVSLARLLPLLFIS
jgi:hypothetical protein